MAGADYQIWLYDTWGSRIGLIGYDQIIRLSYVQVLNGFGALTLTTLRDTIPDVYAIADARLEVWRKPPGGAWSREGNTIWLIQTNVVGMTATGSRYRRVVAYSATHLLSRRLVAAVTGSAAAVKLGASDDISHSYANQALGNSPGVVSWDNPPIVVSRSWSATISVVADVSAGIPVQNDGAYKNLLTVLQDVAKEAAAQLVPLYFNVVVVGSTLQFQTYIQQPGVDRTTGANRLVISPERGSLGGTVELVRDYSDVATFVYAGGPGQGNARIVVGWGDLDQMNLSPWGLREAWIDASQVGRTPAGFPDNASGIGYSSDGVETEARTEVRRRRPTKTLTGTLLSVPGTEYGVDWFHGDRLVAEFEGESFEALVDQVAVTIEGGAEQISAGRTTQERFAGFFSGGGGGGGDSLRTSPPPATSPLPAHVGEPPPSSGGAPVHATDRVTASIRAVVSD